MSFACEDGAFRKLQSALGEHAVQLLDTYDVAQARAAGGGAGAAAVGRAHR